MGRVSSKIVNISKDNPSIMFDKTNCDNCGICASTCSFNVGVYGFSNDKHPCINCGSCTVVCPKRCLKERDETDKLRDLLHSGKTIVMQTAPSVRVTLGDEFGYVPGTNVQGKMITALKYIGADYVFDTTFGADLTVMEEANEFVDRINKGIKGPMLTSCCPSWVKFIKMFYPEYLDNLSTCKSPISMQGTIIKKYFSKVNNINKEDIVSIAIVPCTAKKMEIKLYDDIDLAITVRELARYLKEENVSFDKLKDSNYNSFMSRGSGGGVIFGTSGGVMESTIREVYHIITGRKPSKKLLNFTDVRGISNIKEASIKIKGRIFMIAVINGTGDARKVIEDITNGKRYYDFIEVMACEGGCISGGGNPLVYSPNADVKKKRMNALYTSDKRGKIRVASNNSDIKKVYNDFLGSPLSDVSKEYLHTIHDKNFK